MSPLPSLALAPMRVCDVLKNARDSARWHRTGGSRRSIPLNRERPRVHCTWVAPGSSVVGCERHRRGVCHRARRRPGCPRCRSAAAPSWTPPPRGAIDHGRWRSRCDLQSCVRGALTARSLCHPGAHHSPVLPVGGRGAPLAGARWRAGLWLHTARPVRFRALHRRARARRDLSCRGGAPARRPGAAAVRRRRVRGGSALRLPRRRVRSLPVRCVPD